MHNWSLVVRRNAELHPDQYALIGLGKRWTWGQLYERVNSLAQGLLDLGLRKGDMVGILLNNCLEWIELTFAINQIGAVWLPMNYRLSSNEFNYILNHAEAKAVFSEPDYIPLITAIPENELPTVKYRVNVDANTTVPGWSSYHEMVDKNMGARPGHVEVELDDLHRLMYTSGTTALPKGVMLTYGNLYWKNMAHVLYLGLSPANKTLVVAPLYHVGGMDAPATSTLYAGGTLVILKRFDVIEILKNIEKERVTDTMLTPAMCIMAFNEPTFKNYDVSSIKFIIDGGEKMPEHLIRKFKEKFPGAWFADAYGMTETLSCDTFLAKDKMLSKLGSVGRPSPHVDIRILDDDDNEVPRGQLGEVCMKGPKVTKGYWKDPETTAATIKNGWLHSGDIGKMDEDGYVYIEDRKKDMIISGGENIASPEVEKVIYELPEVLECAVVGIPHPKWLETPMAYIVLKEGATLTPEAIQSHVAKKLAKFKVPKIYEFISKLPRNPSGKVLKRELRANYLKGRTATPIPEK